MVADEFASAFEGLTERRPFGWQTRLFHQILRGDIPDACDIPTGLGKTSVIVIWLLALASQAEQGDVRLPRRLVYVVNRRTVVDQATDIAMQLRQKLREASGRPDADALAKRVRDALSKLCVDPEDDASPIAISTLRGELADNREWQADPARAAIIIGTVDMVGSRLLFQGYRAGRSSRRALSAGLLGRDALLLIDEAHLVRPFARLVTSIAGIQKDKRTITDKGPKLSYPLQVMEMSATRQDPTEDGKGPTREGVFALNEGERRDPIVALRLGAKKALRIAAVSEQAALPQALAHAALRYRDEQCRVLVYCRRVMDAQEVEALLSDALKTEPRKSAEDRVAMLIGTLRGYERDQLADNRVFKEFKADPDRSRVPASIFLVATSAGEVGVDLDADHLICDLTTLDSMIQRLGRVNRLGREDEKFVALIDVFQAPPGKLAKDEDAGHAANYERARERTEVALRKLDAFDDERFNASPEALSALVEKMRAAEDARDQSLPNLTAAFALTPRVLPLTDILLDNWALTSVQELPGRRPVADWLHGKGTAEPPETTIAWREEVDELATAFMEARLEKRDVMDWFARHRIEPQERLRETPARAAKAFDAIARRAKLGGQALFVIVIKDRSALSVSIDKLSDQKLIAGATVVLPVRAGGLTSKGILDGLDLHASDVADVVREQRSATSGADSRTRKEAEKPPPRRWRARLSKEDGAWSAEAVGPTLDERVAAGLARFNAEQREDAATANRSIAQVIPALARAVKHGQGQMAFVEAERILLVPADEPDAVFRMLVSFAPAKSAETAIDRSEAAPQKQELWPHLCDVRRSMKLIAEKLRLSSESTDALVLAAGTHDVGKHRRPWQRAIGNDNYPGIVLAKSDHRRFNADLCGNYRHEFGSLIDAMRGKGRIGNAAIDALLARIAANPERDLIFYLIASHHGWARPHFSLELDDPEADGGEISAALAGAPRFFARMQQRFGYWELAWLEGLLKAADVMATKNIGEEEGKNVVAPAGDVAVAAEARV